MYSAAPITPSVSRRAQTARGGQGVGSSTPLAYGVAIRHDAAGPPSSRTPARSPRTTTQTAHAPSHPASRSSSVPACQGYGRWRVVRSGMEVITTNVLNSLDLQTDRLKCCSPRLDEGNRRCDPTPMTAKEVCIRNVILSLQAQDESRR